MRLKVKDFFDYLKPKQKTTISQWADKYRILSKESASEPGRFRTNRAEYQRGIMDAFNDASIETVVVMTSAQVGKTTVLENILGYYIHFEPAPILVLQPTLEMAQAFSKDRLMPMFRDTEVLENIVGDLRSKKSESTILHKKFPGGHITMAGANSPASLASRPIKILLADEVDRYPLSAGQEGDPVNLAKKRTTTFWDRKIYLCSTPTVSGQSRIEAAYEESDMRKFYVPCPYCGEKQVLKWENVVWDDDKAETAMYKCPHCKKKWSDAERWTAISKGEWKAEKKTHKTAGFWLNEIYSSWVKLSDMVENFLKAKDDPQRLKTFVNTSLAETWEEDLHRVDIDVDDLEKRKEPYSAEVPMGAHILTAGVDTQDDRFEIEVVGWGKGMESWSIDYKIIAGDPARLATQDLLDAYLRRIFKHESGLNMPIFATAIDTGGHKTESIYNYCKKNFLRKVFAIKGSNSVDAPITTGRFSKKNAGKVPLFQIGVNAAKDEIFTAVQAEEPGTLYMHYPKKEIYSKEYFEQFKAEKRNAKGRWVQVRRRNEAIDCRVYAMAALKIVGVDPTELAEAKKVVGYIRNKPKKTKKKKNSWLNGG